MVASDLRVNVIARRNGGQPGHSRSEEVPNLAVRLGAPILHGLGATDLFRSTASTEMPVVQHVPQRVDANLALGVIRGTQTLVKNH
jgi:hypothetical protein